MKKTLACAALAVAMMAQIGVAMAEDMKKGPMTESSNQVWQVASFPLRLTTGVAGLAVGAVGGGIKGIAETEQEFADNTYGKADENPFMVPVGLVGSVVAVPVGFVMGVPAGAEEGGKYGYQVWDSF